jgi:hypothetical protein
VPARRSPFRHAGVAISLKKARLLRFTRNDNFLNRDLGGFNVLRKDTHIDNNNGLFVEICQIGIDKISMQIAKLTMKN